MGTISLRMDEEDEKLIKEYAKTKNITVSSLIRNAVLEKIEDEIDLKAILDYEERLKNGEVEYISFDEVKKRLEM